jgi:DNA-binding MarR family transcriptional regulator
VHADLQPSSYLMLAYLAETGPMRSSTIAETFDVDKGAVSRQVQHLTDLGLAERAPDPDDGRASLVSASEDAVRRLADVSEHRRKVLDERLGGWSDEDLMEFVRILGRYNASLEINPSGE